MASFYVQISDDDLLDALRDGTPRRIMVPLGSRPGALHIRAAQRGIQIWSRKAAGQAWDVGCGPAPSRAATGWGKCYGKPASCCDLYRATVESMPRDRWRRFAEDPQPLIDLICATRDDRWYHVEREGQTWLVYRYPSEAAAMLA